VAVVITLVETKQLRINVHKRNNTKNTAQTIQNAVKYTYYQNTHYKTHTCTHPLITKQVKTTTVQDTPKRNSHNTINQVPSV